MVEVVSRVCDMCGGTDARQVGVTLAPSAMWLIDLCPACSEPITRWRQKARASTGKRKPYRKFQKTDEASFE